MGFASQKGFFGPLSKLFNAFLPAFFMVGYVIGTGSVTTMASAGASYGMQLLWTLVLASLFTHVMVVAVSKMTIVHRRSMLALFRSEFGGLSALGLMGGMMITQIASIIGVMGILSDVVREWSTSWIPGGVHPLGSSLCFMGILLGVFWTGRHQTFLRAVSWLVGLMGLAFLLTAGLVPPSWKEVLTGFWPRIPATGEPHLLIAGMVGTTLASVCLFSRSIVVQEEGWTVEQLPTAYRDSAVAAILLLIINAAIMAAAAGTLHREGLAVRQAIDMVRTLHPLAGSFAATAFLIGIVAAGLSSLFPNYILGVWLITDFWGLRRDLTRAAFRLLVFATACCSLVVPVFGGRPVQLMIASQAISPLVMPWMTLLTWLALRRAEARGQCRNSRWLHLGMALTLLFTTYMLVVAVVGFLNSAGPA